MKMYRLLYSFIVLGGATLPFVSIGMDNPAPHVKLYVKNSLWSVWGAPSIQVNTTIKGKEASTTVRPKQENIVGYVDLIDKMEIQGYGKMKQGQVASMDIPLNQVINEWQRLHAGQEDDIIMDISWKDWKDISSNEVTFTFSTRPLVVPLKSEPRMDNPLTVFGDITHYKLGSSLTADMIERAGSWKEVLIPAGWVERATTAEDAYRYILGLTENYTADDIKIRHRELISIWHPDKVPKDEKSQKFGAQVSRLINKAKNGLEQALEDKRRAAAKGWVNL